jgi:hypothetical protein
MKRAFHSFVAFLLIVSTARAGPEFRVVTGLLTLFDGGKKNPIRYNTQTDVNFQEGGSVRVFSTVTPEGMAEVEVMARSKVDFYFLGADVSLAPSGTIRATVENIQHPQIKLTWDGGIASASKVLQTPEELLSYFIVSQPPVFSKSPIADDELSRIYPQTGPSADPSRSGSPDTKDAVEVDFPVAAPSPTKGPGGSSAKPTATGSTRPKPSPSPRSRPAPAATESDKALLAQTVHSPPDPSPTPKSASAHSGQTPEAIAKPTPSPSPDLMPDLPTSDFPSPEIILGGRTSADRRARQTAAQPRAKSGKQAAVSETAPILKSLLPGAAPIASAAALGNAIPASVQSPQLAKDLTGQTVDLLNWTGAQTPEAMPTMHAPIAKLVPEFLPLILPSGSDQNPHPRGSLPVQAVNTPKDGPRSAVSIQRPDIVLGGQKEFTQVLRALPVDNVAGLGHDAAAQSPRENVPDPVVFGREPFATRTPEPQTTPFVISSAIMRKNP